MKSSMESSACWVARMVVWISSFSPERKRSTEAEAFWLKDSTRWMAPERTSWKAPPDDGVPAGRMSSGSAMPDTGRMGAAIVHLSGVSLASQVDGPLDHVFDRGHGSH